MSPKKLRSKYDHACNGKIRHENSLTALHHANSLTYKQEADRITIYDCDFCAGLHVGHSDIKTYKYKQEFLSSVNQ